MTVASLDESQEPPVQEAAHPSTPAVERVRRLVEELAERNRQLEAALVSRVTIEQAKGILAERYGIGIDDAFQLLRSASRSHRLKIHTLASAVVASPDTPPEIEEERVLPRRRRFSA